MAPRTSKPVVSSKRPSRPKAGSSDPSPAHPGAAIAKLLAQRGITESAAAFALDCSLRTVNQIVCGRRALTVDMACRLERFLDVKPDDWLHAQVKLDIWNWHRRQAAKRGLPKQRTRPVAGISLLPPIAGIEHLAEG